jgi:beta-N-acetylhexosaminidase
LRRVLRIVVTAVAALAAAAPASAGPLAQDPPSRPTPAQLAGQRIVFSFKGTTPPRALMQRIARGEAAGVILFGRNVESVAQVRRLVARLERVPRAFAPSAPLLVMVDQEGGPVRRIPGPPRRRAGSVSRTDQATRDGQAAGRLLASVGVNVDLAPVADVARPGSAMESEGRSYGSAPRRVAALAGAFASGLEDEGVAATAKHFPGFGAATLNTDDGAVRLDTPLAELRAVDEAPFGVLIRTGVPMVMLSNAVYTALDRRNPAGISRRIATTELRRVQRFRGVSITDDLQASATARIGPGGLALRGARAGTDLLLFAQTYRAGDRAARTLERAIRTGRVKRAGAQSSLARVLRLRQALGRQADNLSP